MKLLNIFQGLLLIVLNILKFLCSMIRVVRDMAGIWQGTWDVRNCCGEQIARKTSSQKDFCNSSMYECSLSGVNRVRRHFRDCLLQVYRSTAVLQTVLWSLLFQQPEVLVLQGYGCALGLDLSPVRFTKCISFTGLRLSF